MLGGEVTAPKVINGFQENHMIFLASPFGLGIQFHFYKLDQRGLASSTFQEGFAVLTIASSV